MNADKAKTKQKPSAKIRAHRVSFRILHSFVEVRALHSVAIKGEFMNPINKKANVLLTSVGGHLSVFIFRALRQSNLDIRIVACDCNYLAAGLYRGDVGYLIPHSKDEDYISKIIDIIKKEKVDIVIPGLMAEVLVLAKNAELIKNETGAYVVSSPERVLDIANDKWNLVCFLKSNGLDYPRSGIPEDKEGFQTFLDTVPPPYVVKDRFGAGSVGLSVVKSQDKLEFALKNMSNPIVQEYLLPDDEEYTVGCFCDQNSNPVGSIVMKRKLGLGYTSKAQVVLDEKISDYCERIAKTIGFIGPCNLQLRNTARGPVLFEINPRFSSTESARAYYNFNMPEMCIRHFVFHEEIPRPVVKSGYFFRVFDDVYVDGEAVEKTRTTGVSKEISGVIVPNF